jgi:hypothetical protein
MQSVLGAQLIGSSLQFFARFVEAVLRANQFVLGFQSLELRIVE